MNKLEQKIKSNKSIVEEKFVSKSKTASKNQNQTKSSFSDGWNSGWGNYGKTSKPVKIKS